MWQLIDGSVTNCEILKTDASLDLVKTVARKARSSPMKGARGGRVERESSVCSPWRGSE